MRAATEACFRIDSSTSLAAVSLSVVGNSFVLTICVSRLKVLQTKSLRTRYWNDLTRKPQLFQLLLQFISSVFHISNFLLPVQFLESRR